MPLPDFLIIGAQKAGTTAVWYNLSLHSGVRMNRQTPFRSDPEVHFFDDHWEQGVDWYASLFPSRGVRWPRRLLGEKTPSYLLRRLSLQRMHATVPDARLIVLLRHPVDRAYSQWNHFNQLGEQAVKIGWRRVSFERAFEEDVSMIRKRGHYGRQLRRLFEIYPREQVHVVIQERLRARRDEEYARLLAFLRLGRAPHRFRDAHVREYDAALEPRLRASLMKTYAKSNRELFDLLGERIPEWE